MPGYGYFYFMSNAAEKIFGASETGRNRRIFVFILLGMLFLAMIDAGGFFNRGFNYVAAKTGGAIKLPAIKEIPFHFGLDLQGGTHLVYQADMSQISGQDYGSALNGVRDVIERRVNVFGVSEPNVQSNISGGEYRLIVELAGITDINEAIKMIGETPLLEFKEQDQSAPEATDAQQEEIKKFNENAEKRAGDILGKLLSGGDFASLARELSEDPASKDQGGDTGFLTEATAPELAAIAKKLKVGDFTKEVQETSAGYEIIKLEEERAKANPFNEQEKEKEVKAAHILICYEGIAGCANGLSKEEALKKIVGLKKQANTKNFIELAKKNSTEPNAQNSGGELGWFSREMMVQPFSEAAFALPVGVISEPVETDFGYHLIYKQEEREIKEYRLRRILIKKKSAADYQAGDINWKNTELSGKHLSSARVQFNPNDGTPEVSLSFNSEGASLFEDITGRNVGGPVAIFLDGYPISTPRVNEKIIGGQAVISGKFNIQEAKLLAQRLNAGALPVPISLISQQTIGPSLGKISLEKSVRAGIIGLLLVSLFMIIYYRLPGLIAVFALVFYGLLLIAIFKLLPITLTLSGMAGVILSIGMAVDANVLIFARLKEERMAGRSYDQSVEESVRRAWPSIRDGNFSTLITCFVLIIFTTSMVKGFAITLFIGVSISMFTAIVITKQMLKLVSSRWLERNSWLVGAVKKK